MRRPKPRGSAINMRRVRTWVEDFYGYRTAVTEARIDRWIKQFQSVDRDLAARVLDCVEFISHEKMTAALRQGLRSVPGWTDDDATRQGKWRFVAYSESAGESGDMMLSRLRLANALTQRRYNPLFIHRSELLREGLGPDDSVVFVDDFSGTGDQVCGNWPIFQELLPGDPKVYLILVGATVSARDRIARETEMSLVTDVLLNEQDNVFASRFFTPDEKANLLRYCELGDRKKPRGWGDCGLLVVFAHRCPNDSVPVLHADNRKWEGLFRRHG